MDGTKILYGYTVFPAQKKMKLVLHLEDRILSEDDMERIYDIIISLFLVSSSPSDVLLKTMDAMVVAEDVFGDAEDAVMIPIFFKRGRLYPVGLVSRSEARSCGNFYSLIDIVGRIVDAGGFKCPENCSYHFQIMLSDEVVTERFFSLKFAFEDNILAISRIVIEE